MLLFDCLDEASSFYDGFFASALGDLAEEIRPRMVALLANWLHEGSSAKTLYGFVDGGLSLADKIALSETFGGFKTFCQFLGISFIDWLNNANR